MELDEKVLASIEELGVQIGSSEVEVGETYPIFGVITGIEEEGDGNVVAIINHNIRAEMYISKEDRLNVLKSRAFESGIFVATVKQKDPEIVVECQAVIFGKSQVSSA
jgi:hypothetical protein